MRGGGRRPPHRDNERKFADQGAGTRHGFGAAGVLDPE